MAPSWAGAPGHSHVRRMMRVQAERLVFAFGLVAASLRWPFHKDNSAAFLLHLTVGLTVCVLPVYAVLVVLLKDPGYSGVAALTGGLVA